MHTLKLENWGQTDWWGLHVKNLLWNVMLKEEIYLVNFVRSK